MPPHCNSLRGEELPRENQEGWEGPRELTMRRDPYWGHGGELGVIGGQDRGDPELPLSTVQALPIRVGPANLDGERTYQY